MYNIKNKLKELNPASVMQGRKEDCAIMKNMTWCGYLCSYHKQYQEKNLNLINKNSVAHLWSKHLGSAVLVKPFPGLQGGWKLKALATCNFKSLVWKEVSVSYNIKSTRSCIVIVIAVILTSSHLGVQGFRCTQWLRVLRWDSALLRMLLIPNHLELYSPFDVLGFISITPGNTHGNCMHESPFKMMNPYNI